jgi:uncharacterized membrane protein AbrB (regulator of aidB expression)
MSEHLLILLESPAAIMHQSLAIQIPEIIGIPVLAFTIMVLIKEDRFVPQQAAQIGMELSILAAGACGAIFANDTLFNKWGVGLIVYGILVVMLCILFAAVLSRVNRRQRERDESSVSAGQAFRHLTLGAVPLGLVTAILIFGYTLSP